MTAWALLPVSIVTIASPSQRIEAKGSDGIFDDTRVHAVHMTLSREEYDNLDDTPFIWSRGTVDIDGETLRDVGIQRKGYTTRQAGSPKTSFKLSFVKFRKGRVYDGQRRLVLNARSGDPSLMREKLAYELFRGVGCKVPRASYATVHLTITGRRPKQREFLGLYLLVEHIGKPFLDDRFGGHSGTLYRNLRARDPFASSEPMNRSFRLKTHRQRGDFSRMDAFARAVRRGGRELDRWMDVDAFLRCLAVNTAIVNLDSYAGVGKNFFFYDDPLRKKFVFIPWDMDQAFGGLPYDSREAMIDFDIFAPEVGGKVLIRRVLEVPAYRERYRTILEDLLRSAFSPAVLHARIDELGAVIAAPLSNDLHAPFEFALHQQSLEEDVELPGFGPLFRRSFGLKVFVLERHRSMAEQLLGRRTGAALHRLQGL